MAANYSKIPNSGLITLQRDVTYTITLTPPPSKSFGGMRYLIHPLNASLDLDVYYSTATVSRSPWNSILYPSQKCIQSDWRITSVLNITSFTVELKIVGTAASNMVLLHIDTFTWGETVNTDYNVISAM